MTEKTLYLFAKGTPMTKRAVGLIDMGERLPLNVRNLAKTLNRLQTSYQFNDAGVITSDALGEPDIEGKWYDIPRLAALAKDRASGRFDFLVGITNCRITHTREDPVSSDRDYFSRSDFREVAIMSVNKSLLKYHPTGKSILQVAAFLLISEVAIMTAKTDLNHFDNPYCVFNECEDRNLLADCIESGEICHRCESIMNKANIPNSTIASLRSILEWCSKNSWGHACAKTIQNPATLLIAGTGIGWFTSLFFGKENYLIMIGIIALAIIVTLYLAKTSHAPNQK